MKKIINGKMYNTETATLIDCFNNGLGQSDFNHWEITLYKKKNGEFFELGSGGANTVFGHSCGNNTRCGGTEIVPISINEAMRLVEKNCDTDTYIKLFGEPEE